MAIMDPSILPQEKPASTIDPLSTTPVSDVLESEHVLQARKESEEDTKSSAPLSPPIPSPPLQHPEYPASAATPPSSEPEKRELVGGDEPPAKRIKSDDESATAPTTAEPVTPADSAPAAEPAPASTAPVLNGPPLAKHQNKFAHSMIRSLKRLKDAYPFLVPVDPIKLNVPDYFKIVSHPMDLSTMEKKLSSSQYSTVDQFVADFDLMIANCIKFNGPESKIAEMGRSLKSSFERQLKQMPAAEVVKPESGPGKRKKSLPKSESTESFALTPSGVPIIRRDSASLDSTGRPKREIHPPKPRDLPYAESKPRRKKYAAELKFCQTVLKELTSKKYESFSFPFLQPVDPVALNCPSYFKVIKKPMDISTIQNKLNTNQYESGAEFEEDIRLMFRNCYKFNPDASPVNIMGHRLEAVFDKKWEEKPAPPPSSDKRTSDSADESEFSEEESDEEEEDPSDKTISYLEQQLLAMQNQLSMMKKLKKDSSKKKKKEKTSKKSAPRKRKSSTGQTTAPLPHVSYDMKKELSEKITTLSGQKLTHVVKMIHESMPHLKKAGQEEIELDVDQLDPVTLMKLYTYVTKNSPSSTVNTTAVVAPAPQKSKRKGKEEQKKQIAQLEKQIKSFQKGDESSSDESSSEEDSDESESSEEE
ncbi:Bromodomain-containing protein [Lipomyces kononenkoae]|uniref:Bromodomain-containing protein n=1 Tax=Lipomyces kononenkoae TaxID=34357 RepID=A0ACC3TAS5_LIPKO